jgi:signal peptidase I
MENFREDNLNLNEFNRSAESKLKYWATLVWEMIKIAAVSLAIIIPVRYFLIQPFYVKGASMEPNFFDHEYLIIDEISYRLSEPQRGDIVVFKYPKDPSQYFIKRIVGLPGEQIMIDNGRVHLKIGDQFKAIQEDYLSNQVATNLPLQGYSSVALAADEYFLLGDNRDQSLDSRVFGPVRRDFIIGRTWLRGWPVNRLTVFSAPEYKF